MTRILSIDTTSKHISLALAEDRQVIIEQNFKSRQEISSMLVPAIASMLSDLGWQANDIDLFGICVGPGLFTGIRIGLSTLKGLVFGNSRPMVPVTSLEALACKQETYSRYPVAVPIIDAKRDEIYMAAYDNSGPHSRQTLSPRILHIDQLVEAVKDIPQPCFIGSGVDAHRDLLTEKFGGQSLIHRSNFLAAEICSIAFREFEAGKALNNLQEILPLYIRQPDAQKKHDSASAKDGHPTGRA